MEVSQPKSWSDQLASLVEDRGMRFAGDSVGVLADDLWVASAEEAGKESLKDQIKGFVAAWGEIMAELGKGCRDVAQQTILAQDSYIVKKTRGPLAEVSEKMRLLNEFLPEDRDPVHVWPVIFFVCLLALAVLNVNCKGEISISTEKKVAQHPLNAARVLLPDGRHIAYHETGVPADKARFSLIVPHGFLSSRLSGFFRINSSLLEAFGVRLISYDLPGFGQSSPHHDRILSSSALDMLQLADRVGVKGKFWVVGYSSGALHAWAALKYIPNRVAGAAMFAPFVNPYDEGMTRKEKSRTWKHWHWRRRLLFYLARRFPNLLSYFYNPTFVSGKHGRIDKWLSLSLCNKDKYLVETSAFEEFWQGDVQESTRQGSSKPFLEEVVLQVSNWGFSLVDLQARRKCNRKDLLPWLQFLYRHSECELAGYLGPIHIWQGMDDSVVPPAMTDYVQRVLSGISMHRLPMEGHFSYFFYCEECQRKIFSNLFGSPQGSLHTDEAQDS